MSGILCGPIVRRTTPSEVCIWIATEDGEQLGGEIRDRATQAVVGIDHGTRKVKLGDNFFVHLIRVRPQGTQPFAQDTILCYDIYREQNGSRQSLLADDAEIRYAGEPLPGFVIPSKLRTILHGSCRKPHAPAVKSAWGAADQLSVGDDLLADSFADAGKRPSLLLMTGDQIYADDVGGPLLDHLIRLGGHLTGWNEIVPRRRPPSTGPVPTPDDHLCAADIQLYRRGPVLSDEWTGFTSTEKANHLLTFGEYAAMYLTVWGGPGAKPQLRDWAAVQGRINPSASRNEYERELNQLREFCAGLGKVRRLLANITVHMIFDDHDVTDDWNLNPDWEDKVNASPRGRRTVANALAACWACQSWGNNPEAFGDAFIRTLADHLASRAYEGTAADAFDAMLWEKKPDRWAFTIDTEPPIVALDTRTCRQTGSHGPAKAVKLMNPAALAWLQGELNRVAAGSHACLVSATPAFGLKAIEGMQAFFTAIGISPASLDNESWAEGFPELQQAIASLANPPASIAILSGDVHYSFTRKGSFNGNGKSVAALQLTSSPLHNEPPALSFSSNDVLVQHGGFIASVEKDNMGKGTVVTAINNLARIDFDDHGKAKGEVLLSRLPDGSQNRVTYND